MEIIFSSPALCEGAFSVKPCVVVVFFSFQESRTDVLAAANIEMLASRKTGSAQYVPALNAQMPRTKYAHDEMPLEFRVLVSHDENLSGILSYFLFGLVVRLCANQGDHSRLVCTQHSHMSVSLSGVSFRARQSLRKVYLRSRSN